MWRPRRRAAVVAIVACGSAAAAALTLQSALARGVSHYSQGIYKITVTFPDRSGNATTASEWVSLANGTWRAELENQTFISSDDSYVVVDHDSGSVYHRTGSPSFMHDLHDRPEGVVALDAYLVRDPTLADHGLHLRVGKDAAGKTRLDVLDDDGKQAFGVVIDGRVSDETAAAAHLLDTAPVQPQVTDTELRVGVPPRGDVRAYWFGPATATWHASAAAEHWLSRTAAQVAAGMSRRSEGDVHVTFYERPGARVTSAEPGLRNRPDGELQVSSEPIGSAHAQALLDAFNGTNGDETYPAWPRTTITLADGEQAVVVPNQFDGTGAVRPGFFVITDATLVSVSGDVETDAIGRLAAMLRPLA